MKEMRETDIEYVVGEPTLTVYTAEQKYIRRIKQYAEERPDEVAITDENADGSMVVKMPASWMRFPKPPKKMNYTEEQRQEMAERLAAYRKQQSTQPDELQL